MDPSNKRKADENGNFSIDAASNPKFTSEDARKIIEPFTQEQLLDILQNAAVHHLDVLDAVRSISDRDPAQRKLFIRGLGWETTTGSLHTLFSSYGDLEEAIVILDKVTGKSKGFGFVTFKHIDGALLALKEPSKKIDGRMTVTQLAATGISGPTVNAPVIDASMRKIFVGNVPVDMPGDRLLAHFSSYGEVEEGPLGYDKQTGKSRGFALFVYKNAEAAKASLVDPTKTIDGHQLVCRFANEGKRGKFGVPGVGVGAGGFQTPTVVPGEIAGDGVGFQPPSSYGGFSGGHQGPPATDHHHHHMNTSLPVSIGAQGLSSVGSQVPSSLGGGSGYGAGLGGPYGTSQLGGPASGGYGAGLGGPYGTTQLGGPASGGYGAGLGGLYGTSQLGGPASGGYGGLGGGGSSMYRLPPSSVGMPSGGYPESGHYGLSSSAYPGQHHLQSGMSPVPRVPPGGMYQSMPPYY